MPSKPHALPLLGSETTASPSVATPRCRWQWVQLVVLVLTGAWSKRFAWWAAAMASMVWVATASLVAGLQPNARDDIGFDDRTLSTDAVEAASHHRVVDPLEHFAECEQPAITDAAEEIKVEALSALHRADKACASTRLARELCASCNTYAAFAFPKSLGDQHAARGPPRA